MKTYRFIVTGTVQGVWYRKSVWHNAIKASIKGYVKNLEDGNVEAVATLNPQELRSFLAILEEGSKNSTVKHISQEILEEALPFESFDIKY